MNLIARFGLACASVLIAWPAQAEDPCPEWVARIPTLSKSECAKLDLQPSTGRSVQGRMLWTHDVAPAHASLKVLVLGTIHGDERSAAAVTLRWMALAQALPENTHWRFIPVLNPDGLLRRGGARRTNAHGVDLNRNFPTPNWHDQARTYWAKTTRKDPRRYPGPAPLSEPESRFLVEQLREFKPDVVVSVHAPFGVLDFDGALTPPAQLGRLYLDPLGVYPGSLGHYGGVHNSMPVVTVELPHAIKVPPRAEVLSMWQDLRRWLDRTVVAQKKSTDVLR
ncbi:MAG: hypothetical protein Fur007_16600 [Rhodoferax sp.]